MQLQEENGGAGRNRTHSVLKESASCRNYESIKRTKRIKIHPLTHVLTHEMRSDLKPNRARSQSEGESHVRVERLAKLPVRKWEA